jgi:hypothetical protein
MAACISSRERPILTEPREAARARGRCRRQTRRKSVDLQDAEDSAAGRRILEFGEEAFRVSPRQPGCSKCLIFLDEIIVPGAFVTLVKRDQFVRDLVDVPLDRVQVPEDKLLLVKDDELRAIRILFLDSSVMV